MGFKHWVEGAPLLKHSVSEAIFFPSSSNDICKNLLIQEPGHHLLADPDNCNKFFSCQYVSETGWLAYSLSCPQGTHFDGVNCESIFKFSCKRWHRNLEIVEHQSLDQAVRG